MKFFILLTFLFNFYTGADTFTKNEIENRIDLCKNAGPATDFDIEEYLYAKYPKVKGELEVFSVKLNNPRSGLLTHFLSLTKNVDKENNYIDAREVFLDDSYKSCQSTLCLADKVFGEGLGAYYLYILSEFNFNLSHLVNEYSGGKLIFSDLALFTEHELQVIIKSLNLLPKTALENIEYGYHAKKIDYYKGSTIANAQISFYKLWSDLSSHEKVHTVIHELAHVFAESIYSKEYDHFSSIEVDTSREWASFSGWQWDRDKIFDVYFSSTYDTSMSNFVSRYARQNPIEDFAESFSAYVLNSKSFQSVAPYKYLFIKENVFNDLTFPSYMCMSEFESRDDFVKLEVSKLDSEELQIKVSKECLVPYVKSLTSRSKTQVNKCIYQKMTNKKFFPLTLSPKALERNFAKLDSYKKIKEKLVSNFIATLGPSKYCETHPTLFVPYRFEQSGESIMLSNSQFSKELCRWTTKRSKRFDEPFDQSLEAILLSL